MSTISAIYFSFLAKKKAALMQLFKINKLMKKIN